MKYIYVRIRQPGDVIWTSTGEIEIPWRVLPDGTLERIDPVEALRMAVMSDEDD